MMNWEEELLEYNSYLSLVKKLSGNSIRAYMVDIEDFINYIRDNNLNIKVNNVKKNDIKEYFKYMDLDKFCPSSQSRKVSGLRSFFNYLAIYGKSTTSPLDKIETPRFKRKIPETISIGEVETIFKHLEVCGDKPADLRNFAIIDTLYSTGLRVSELIGLTISNIFPEDGYIKIMGKGSRERLVPINPDTIARIMRYRETLPSDASDIAFLNNRNKGLTREMIFTIVKTACIEAGIEKKVSPHTFRHTYATHLVNEGVDIRLIQEIMGHESITTTEIYTHVDTSHKRKLIEVKHPLSKKTE